MALALTLLSLALCYFSPGEVFPTLAPYHLQQIILLPAVAASLPSLIVRREFLPSPHYLLMVGLWFAVTMSLLTRFWIHGSFDAFLDFGLVVMYYFLVLVNAFKPSRVRIICTALAACAVAMSIQGIITYHTGSMEDQLLQPSLEGMNVSQRLSGFG